MPAWFFNPSNQLQAYSNDLQSMLNNWDFAGAAQYAALYNSMLAPFGIQLPSNLTDINAAISRLSPEEQQQYSKLEAANNILAAGNQGNNGLRLTKADLINNPDKTAQQLANDKVVGYWSNESEAYSRVINAANTNPDKLKFGTDENGNITLSTGEHPGYDTLTLTPTGQPGVYQFSTYNQVAGGNIHGVIGADPTTGKVVPVVNAAQQFAYTPGSSGSFFGNLIGSFGDTFKSLGPLGVVLGNLALPGLGTGLGIAAAIDEGNAGGALTSLATGSVLSNLGVSDALTQATGSEVAGQLGTGTLGGLIAGQDLETALTNAAIGAGINQAAAGLANQTPADFEADVNQVLDTPAEVPASAFEDDINQVLDMPATQTPDIFVDTTAPELPSGMDLASDVVPGTANTLEDVALALGTEGTAISGQDLAADVGPTANTVEDVSQALAGEGTDISGQDLAADATPGNTLEDVSTALTPTTTPTEEKPNLTKEQIAQIIKTGMGLFGGIAAGTKALQGLTGGSTALGTAMPTIAAPTPFTGTYSGMNPYDAAYFQQVQQNYNRLFPSTPANVAAPLESWYQTKFVPDTTISKKLFGV